jgi:hypothetical protein
VQLLYSRRISRNKTTPAWQPREVTARSQLGATIGPAGEQESRLAAVSPHRRSTDAVDARQAVTDVYAPRVQLDGANLLRLIAVLAVLYSHISFYLIDDRGEGWWMIDVVYRVFIQ